MADAGMSILTLEGMHGSTTVPHLLPVLGLEHFHHENLGHFHREISELYLDSVYIPAVGPRRHQHKRVRRVDSGKMIHVLRESVPKDRELSLISLVIHDCSNC